MAVDLTVRGEPVERIFGSFEDRRYLVNRRYQRKLIWTLEEKRSFIDSLIEGYPVPIVLLAENSKREDNALEIIDGMQRLDAVVSFINNKYAVRDQFFDLNTIAVTKALLDSGKLIQRTPIMDRTLCVNFASYLIPISIYEFADENAVDTIFRRINSGGRKLPKQELRSAGSIDHFATVVRRISAKVRGDDSYSDILRLNEMQKISITNRDLDYGIDVETIFWVAHGILSRDNLRQSRDEELVADMVAYMVSDAPIPSRTEFIDDFYGMGEDNKASKERFNDIDVAIKQRSPELVVSDFQRTLDPIRLALDFSSQTFAQLIHSKQPASSPRYFQVIFLAFYQLIIKKGLEVSNRKLLVEKLRNIGDHINMQEGGRWGANKRQAAIDAAVGMLQSAFAETTGYDPAVVHWITQLQNLLSQSYTEQAAYDFKQGFVRLDKTNSFDDESFEKILKTCVAISNIGKGKKGYVLVGVADHLNTAMRIEELFNVKSLVHDKFHIFGIEHEAKALNKNLDQFFQFIVEKISKSNISEPLRSYITSHIKTVRYYDKTVYVFEVIGQEQPSMYENVFYHRSGASVITIENKELLTFFNKYTA